MSQKKFDVKCRGFTMVELTLVAIIILILISIALPNFLEAQIRAKVTAANGDMECLAQALEEYYIGYRAYPLNVVSKLPEGGLSEDGNPNLRGSALTVLTTPVVYLSALPLDQFFPQGKQRELFDYINFVDLTGGPISKTSFRSSGSAAYVLVSVGPNRESDTFAQKIPPVMLLYAPTNGTSSPGDIHRFGP